MPTPNPSPPSGYIGALTDATDNSAYSASASVGTGLVGFSTSDTSVTIPSAAGGAQEVPFDLAGNYDWKSDDVTVDGTSLVIGMDGLYLVSLSAQPTNNLNTAAGAALGIAASGLGGAFPSIFVGAQTVGPLYCQSIAYPLYAGSAVALAFQNPPGLLACELAYVRLSVTRLGPLPPDW